MPRNKSEKVPDWQHELVAFALEAEKYPPGTINFALGDKLHKLRGRLSPQAKERWNHMGTWRGAAHEVFDQFGRDAGPYGDGGSGTREAG